MKNRHLLFLVLLSILGTTQTASAQLQFEGYIFKGYDSPLLANASAIALSPDERHLYTASFNDHALNLFERNLNTGDLSFVANYKNGVNGIAGLGGTKSVIVAPDGRHVYASAESESAIAIFERDHQTGLLQQAGKVENYTGNIDDLNDPLKLQMTNDGNYLLVVCPSANALLVFKRNVVNGNLNLHQTIKDGVLGIGNMTYPQDVEISPDQQNIYVSSFADNAINVFTWNTQTGLLTFAQSLTEGQGGINGLNAASAITTSPDGSTVIVAGQEGPVVFQRAPTTGLLTWLDTYPDGTAGSYLSNISSLAMSQNGNFLLATSSQEDALTVLAVNADQTLTLVQELENGLNGTNGMDFPVDICPAASNNAIYIAGFGSSTLLQFSQANATGMLDQINTIHADSFGGLDGTDGARHIAISPDGMHAYVAGELDDAITSFELDQETGAMTFIQMIEDGSANDGLNGIKSIAISPDGNNVYAAGYWDHSVTIFDRNPNTGLLTYEGRLKDGISGVDGLSGVADVVVSLDGLYLYAAGFLDSGIGVFGRDFTTGELTFQEVVKDGEMGVDGLSNVTALCISPDENYLYAAGSGEAAIAVFSRNVGSGTLSFLEVLKNSTPGVSGLEGVRSIAISEDGQHLYTCSNIDNSVVHFDRNTTDGTLSFTTAYNENSGNANGINGASDLHIHVGQQYIYASAADSSTIIAFERDTDTGNLVQVDQVADDQNEVNGIAWASSVKGSPDGQFVYATGFNDDGVGIFSCVVTNQLHATICQGDAYPFGNEMLDEAGFYESTTTSNGCTIIDQLHLTVSPDSTFLEMTICNGDAVEVGGTVYTQTGNYIHDLDSSLDCDSVVVLNLTVVSVFPETEIQATICEGETYEINGMEFSDTGNYDITFTTSFGCDSMVVLDLEVMPTTENTVSDVACPSEFYIFGTSNIVGPGTYEHVFTNQAGCDSVVILNLTFLPAEIELEATICEGEVFELGGELLDSTGVYEGTLLWNGECEVWATVSLLVVPAITISSTVIADDGSGSGAISIDSIFGGAEPPYILEWSNGASSGELTNLEAGNYQLTISDGTGCGTIFDFEVPDLAGNQLYEKNALQLRLLPNIVEAGSVMELEIVGNKDQKLRLQMVDINGRIVSNENLWVTQSTLLHRVPAPTSTGLFRLQVISENQRYTLPFVVAYSH